MQSRKKQKENSAVVAVVLGLRRVSNQESALARWVSEHVDTNTRRGSKSKARPGGPAEAGRGVSVADWEKVIAATCRVKNTQHFGGVFNPFQPFLSLDLILADVESVFVGLFTLFFRGEHGLKLSARSMENDQTENSKSFTLNFPNFPVREILIIRANHRTAPRTA
ncbi:hypothetical protein VTN31DRAFT_4369 [Thermomyces dupontii]|uniref:uncharacterized protein n=1 Tax=Talaromyces thermophilus TaxID=28565 RepID=UPI003742271C